MDIREKIKKLIQEALESLKLEATDFVIAHPADIKMGDYSTSVAMVLGKSAKKNPKELAQKITEEINKSSPKEIYKTEAVNGFINFYLSPEFFSGSTKEILKERNFGQNKNLKTKNHGGAHGS